MSTDRNRAPFVGNFGQNLGANFVSVGHSAREAAKHQRRLKLERELINAESALGRTIFGRVEPERNREFFCLQHNVWLWHENGTTVRYEVRKDGIYKKINQGGYERISGAELEHFRAACKAYLALVKSNLYI